MAADATKAGLSVVRHPPTPVELAHALHRCIENGAKGLHLYYQPKVDLCSQKITGCEALLRWHTPQWGAIPPTQFIPVAERVGHIVDIGRIVIERAVADMATWHAEGFDIDVAINLSAAQFRDHGLLRFIMGVLDKHGVDAHHLEIELTEGMLASDRAEAAQHLWHFKGLGLSLAIDDFGTGFSALSYLKEFPADVLKIDKSFVDHAPDDLDARGIVELVINIGRRLGMKLVAEGIETARQARFLADAGVEVGQGYLFDRPMPADQFLARLREMRDCSYGGSSLLSV